jgi:hypothetical protein
MVLLLACLAAPAPARELFKGWWIVVGTFPTEPWERQTTDLARVEAKARNCGVETFNDLSGKFKGFAPGYNAFVIRGAFASEEAALAKLSRVKPCFPDAYVKYGQHLGE